MRRAIATTWARVDPTLKLATFALAVCNVLFLWGVHDANATGPCIWHSGTCPTSLNPAADLALAKFYLALGWTLAGAALLATSIPRRVAPITTTPRAP